MNFCICAIVKNENKYLKEWVNYYKNIGFSYFYIFDNNNIDGESPKEILGNDDCVYIDERYRGKHDHYHQAIAYTQFYKENVGKYDWILFCDIDEFLMFEHYNNINDFIMSNNNFNLFDAIAICWKMYDDNDLIYYEDKPVLERFTRPAKNTSWNKQFKSLIKGNLNTHVSLCGHGAYDVNYCDVFGNALKEVKFPNIGNDFINEECWLNHYKFKTLEEFITVKYPNYHHEGIQFLTTITFEYFFIINKCTPEKLELIKKYGFEYTPKK